jgi:hypothetical protein
MANLKPIADVEVLESLTDGDKVVVIGSDGILKQTASSNLGMDITKTETIEEPSVEDTLVVISDGNVKQLPASTFASLCGAAPIVVISSSTNSNLYDYDCMLADGSELPSNLYDLFIAGTPIVLVYNSVALSCVCAIPTDNYSYAYQLVFLNPIDSSTIKIYKYL